MGVEPMWLMLSLMSLMKRLLRSGKKAVVEEVVAGSSHRSVLPKNLITPLRIGSRMAGFGGLLSLLAVHARRRAREELRGGAKIWDGAEPYDTEAARVEHVRSVVRV